MKEIRKTIKIGKTPIFKMVSYNGIKSKSIGIKFFKFKYIYYETE